jgi:hypothetical protein
MNIGKRKKLFQNNYTELQGVRFVKRIDLVNECGRELGKYHIHDPNTEKYGLCYMCSEKHIEQDLPNNGYYDTLLELLPVGIAPRVDEICLPCLLKFRKNEKEKEMDVTGMKEGMIRPNGKNTTDRNSYTSVIGVKHHTGTTVTVCTDIIDDPDKIICNGHEYTKEEPKGELCKITYVETREADTYSRKMITLKDMRGNHPSSLEFKVGSVFRIVQVK